MHSSPRRPPIRPGRVVRWSVLVLALVYAPVAISSMWFTLVPGVPRLQVRLDAFVGGDSYATGPGSVVAARSADYVDHRVLMLVHTVLGGLALVVAAIQWAAALKTSARPHRLLGRSYVFLMATSMIAALLFLVVSPRVSAVGQVAFRWQLWVLALSTLGTGLAAVWHARRAEPEEHRAWMALNLAFMLTAPMLRLLWTCLAPLFPRHDMLTNLEVGAVMLAVIAPAGGAIAAMRTYVDDRGPVGASVPAARGGVPVLVAAAALGCGLVVWRQPGLGPSELPWFHVVPALCAVAICAAGAWRSPGALRAHEWGTVLVGTAVSPWAALLVGIAAAPAIGEVEAYLAGLMVAPGVPVVVALTVVLGGRRASRPRSTGPQVTLERRR